MNGTGEVRETEGSGKGVDRQINQGGIGDVEGTDWGGGVLGKDGRRKIIHARR